eukprot:gnl/TRDRNA2_/TRDRNA2_153083_c1_seq1.p2 gnl/TRDRNA2_/TRDRNA2_153083_c1~~gnl/TRDRNA2_/TRDRNA2_153083_c1_seq1.p2  ORF type:complete len:109 (+),score=15.33 gnl/TRDRNA2_/TRDRNA2_153083_c1_seq1:109-435(+)
MMAMDATRTTPSPFAAHTKESTARSLARVKRLPGSLKSDPARKQRDLLPAADIRDVMDMLELLWDSCLASRGDDKVDEVSWLEYAPSGLQSMFEAESSGSTPFEAGSS